MITNREAKIRSYFVINHLMFDSVKLLTCNEANSYNKGYAIISRIANRPIIVFTKQSDYC